MESIYNITINGNGIFTSDANGNLYYRGVKQNSVGMTRIYFCDAQKYWAGVRLNGRQPMLREVVVCTASNSVIPYNTAANKNPVQGARLSNRVVWYNAKFDVDNENIETGWMCAKLLSSEYEASQSAATIATYAIGKDATARKGVLLALQEALRKSASLTNMRTGR